MFYLVTGSLLNYLSIVEICIDKGLSERDLCRCQLSQRKAPSDTNRIDLRTKQHNCEAFWGASVLVWEDVGWRGVSRSKDFFFREMGGIDRTRWPLTWGRRVNGNSGSVGFLKDHAVKADTGCDTLGAWATLTWLQTHRVYPDKAPT